MSRSTRRGQGSRRLARLRPAAEGLEARALMAFSGVLDPTFNGAGYYSTAVGTGTGGFTGLTAVAVQPNGDVVAGGPVGPATSPNYGLIRLNADGTLDTSFGQGGMVVPAFPSGISATAISQVLLQPDGKILALETVTVTGSSPADSASLVYRFDADGSLDPTFGNGGEVILDSTLIGVSGATFDAAALQANGQVVVAGTTPIASSTNGSTQVAVVRLDADGALDATYGTGGLVTISSFTAAGLAALRYGGRETADAVAVDAQGRAVLSATTSVFGAGGSSSITYAGYVFRLDASGAIDSTLGQVGIRAAGIDQPVADGLLAEPDGTILVAGDGGPGASSGGSLARLGPDGTLRASAKFAGALATQADGKVLVSSFDGVTRLDANLAPDTMFGTVGRSDFAFPTPPASAVASPEAAVNAVAVAPGGQIILAGGSASLLQTGVVDAAFDVVARVTSTGFPQGVPGDYSGDGVPDLAVYIPGQGAFAIRPSQGGADQIIPFGIPGGGQTIPAPGDYDGSGVTEIAAYLPALGLYAYRPAGGGPDVLEAFGLPGLGQSIPAPGDYFGTGQTDIAVYIPSQGAFAIRNPAGGPDEFIPFGVPGVGNSIPAPGDYDGSGRTELAVYLPSLGGFAYRPAFGGPDRIIPFGLPGPGQSIPAPGDYDGSGHDELAVYLPALALYAYRPADGGPDVLTKFGPSGTAQTLPDPDLSAYNNFPHPAGAEFGALTAYFPAAGAFGTIDQPGLEPFGVPGPGQTFPVTVVDEALVTAAGSIVTPSAAVPAASAGLAVLDFLPATVAIPDLEAPDLPPTAPARKPKGRA